MNERVGARTTLKARGKSGAKPRKIKKTARKTANLGILTASKRKKDLHFQANGDIFN
jgi:hypothetical protein